MRVILMENETEPPGVVPDRSQNEPHGVVPDRSERSDASSIYDLDDYLHDLDEVDLTDLGHN